MIRYLKEGVSEEKAATDDAQVRATVEGILGDIENRGDGPVRELSEKFDKWSPSSFRLSKDEIKACYDELDTQAISDIRFAQEQVRNFAQHQRDSMKDVEVETRRSLQSRCGRVRNRDAFSGVGVVLCRWARAIGERPLKKQQQKHKVLPSSRY